MARRVIPAELREQAAAINAPHSVLIVPTKEQRQLFLVKLASGASMHAAASEVGVPFLAFGRLIATDEEFASDLEIARDVLRPMALEEIAIQQATVGIDEVLTHQGRISYEYEGEYEFDENGVARPINDGQKKPITVKKLVTSNPTLLAILKANSDKFRDRTELTMNPLPADVPDKITGEDDRAKLLALLSKRARDRKLYDEDEDLI